MKKTLKAPLVKAQELIEDPRNHKNLARQLAYGEKQALAEELLMIARQEEARTDFATAKMILKLVKDIAREGKNYDMAVARLARIDRTLGVVKLLAAERSYNESDYGGFFRSLRGAEALGLTANVLDALYAVELPLSGYADRDGYTVAKWIRKITDWAIANRTKPLAIEIARIACKNGDLNFCQEVERLNGDQTRRKRIKHKPKHQRFEKLTLFMNPCNGK